MPPYHQASISEPIALSARRRPRQARSLVTVSAILDATVRVLLRHGYKASTTRLIAEVAGVGIGSLYEYFPHKEALIAAVMEREAERCVQVLQKELLASRERPFEAALRAAVQVALEELESRRELLSIVLTDYPYVGQLAVAGKLPERAAEFAALCLERWSADVAVEPKRAVYQVLANMLFGACIAHVLQPSVVSREAMTNTLVEILERILRPRAARAAAEQDD